MGFQQYNSNFAKSFSFRCMTCHAQVEVKVLSLNYEKEHENSSDRMILQRAEVFAKSVIRGREQ